MIDRRIDEFRQKTLPVRFVVHETNKVSSYAIELITTYGRLPIRVQVSFQSAKYFDDHRLLHLVLGLID